MSYGLGTISQPLPKEVLRAMFYRKLFDFYTATKRGQNYARFREKIELA